MKISSVSEMRALDRTAIEEFGIAEELLMENAGQAVYFVMLTQLGIGQSTCVGIGGDPLPGTTFVDVLELFEKDEDTSAVVLIGEIGGSMEQEAAEFIETRMSKPVIKLKMRTIDTTKAIKRVGSI